MVRPAAPGVSCGVAGGQGHTEAGSGPLTLDTRVAATIFRAAAVGSDTRTGLQNFRGQRKTEPS